MCGPTGCNEWAPVTGELLAGEIVVDSLGAGWRPRVEVSAQDIKGTMIPIIDEDGLRLWAKRQLPVDVYYPSTGRFAWQQPVMLHAKRRYVGDTTSVSFNETGSVYGDSAFRTGADCFQFRNVRREHQVEYMTVVYGVLAPAN